MTYQEIRQEIAVIKEMIERLIVPHFDKNESFRINNNEIEKNVQKWWYISEKYRFIKHNGVTLDKIFNIVESLDEIRIVEGKEKAKEYYEKFGIELEGAFDYWISRYDDWIAVYKERLSRNALPYRNSTDRTGSYVLYTTVPYDLMNDYVNKTKKDLSEFYEKYLDTENATTEGKKKQKYKLPIQVLAMNYIFNSLDVNAKSKDKAELIELLTNGNNKNILDYLRNPLQTTKENDRIKEMEDLIKLFTKLGLTNIVKLITKDLHSIQTNNKI